MEIFTPFYSRLFKLARIIFFFQKKFLFAIVFLCLSFTGLKAQDVTATTNVNSSNNPACVNSGITFTATVTDVTNPGTTPTGTVNFVDEITNTIIGTATLDPAGVATLNISTLAAGTYSIQANYLGVGGTYAASSSSAT